jgi:hypothetical protein
MDAEPEAGAAGVTDSEAVVAAGAGALAAGAASPPALRLAPEVEEARAKLVKALHGTLLMGHINLPARQQACIALLLKLIQARALVAAALARALAPSAAQRSR